MAAMIGRPVGVIEPHRRIERVDAVSKCAASGIVSKPSRTGCVLPAVMVSNKPNCSGSELRSWRWSICRCGLREPAVGVLLDKRVGRDVELAQEFARPPVRARKLGWSEDDLRNRVDIHEVS